MLNPLIAMERLIPARRCQVPDDLDSVTTIGAEETGVVDAARIEGIWRLVRQLYRTATHPAIQFCIRHRGKRVLNRAIGHASGNAPDDPPGTPRVPLGLDTPINLFSASKAISAMVVHKLDEENVLRIDDRVSDYIPEFSGGGKQRITLRHVLAHRAGVPNLPPGAMDVDTLSDPDQVIELLCRAKPASRPGRALAYHAVTGGFILGEVVKRVTGSDMREVMREKISRPLGLKWLGCGIETERTGEAALNAFTGYAVLPPVKQVLQRALGVTIEEAVQLSNHPRFLGSIIPSANVFATADEASRFYQCLLDQGEWKGKQLFEPRTVRHAIAEQSYWELDLTLGLPVRYSLGFMLGNARFGLIGGKNPRAFGHIGLTNIFTWADPDRDLSVALLTTGKPIISPHIVPLIRLMNEINSVFSREQN